LFVGNGGSSGPSRIQVPEGLTGDGDALESGAKWEGRRQDRSDKGAKGKKRKGVKDKDWIIRKKEVSVLHVFRVMMLIGFDVFLLQLYRQRGKEDVPRDSKYTGRKRKPVF